MKKEFIIVHLLGKHYFKINKIYSEKQLIQLKANMKKVNFIKDLLKCRKNNKHKLYHKKNHNNNNKKNNKIKKKNLKNLKK